MNPELEREVWQRANHQCEYCLIPQSADITRHQIDHIISRKYNGETVSENLALSCLSCNGHKGSNVAGIEPPDRTVTRLYNPRQDHLEDHFSLNRDGSINGKSLIGRVTVFVLKMNEGESRTLRMLLIVGGELNPSQ